MIGDMIDPTAIVRLPEGQLLPSTTIVEAGCIIDIRQQASLTLGDRVTFYPGCILRTKVGDIKIESDTSFGPGCVIYEVRAGLSIGAKTLIAGHVTISGVNHGACWGPTAFRDQPVAQLPVEIGSNVWIGMNVTILPGVRIGSNAIVGAGSVVTRSIPEDCLAHGVPCKVQRRRNE